MIDAGHRSARNAQGGVAVAPLAKAAKTTREMARRYALGKAIPDTNRIDAIANWLGVRVAWLRDGEGESRAAPVARQPASVYGLSDEAIEIARAWDSLPTERREALRQHIFLEAAVHALAPWMEVHRPSSKSYAEFERRVQDDFKRLGQQLALEL